VPSEGEVAASAADAASRLLATAMAIILVALHRCNVFDLLKVRNGVESGTWLLT
jgi:hypothetical protein